jgi:hypothetical protein
MGKFRQAQEASMAKPGKPMVVMGDGRVLNQEFKDLDEATDEAKRLARKEDDEVYVYVPKVRFQPSEPKVEEVPL